MLERGTQKTKDLVPLCAGCVTSAKSPHLWGVGEGDVSSVKEHKQAREARALYSPWSF